MNKVIPEDTVLDEKSLPKVKMPIGDDYARLPDWKHGTPRLQGYPYLTKAASVSMETEAPLFSAEAELCARMAPPALLNAGVKLFHCP